MVKIKRKAILTPEELEEKKREADLRQVGSQDEFQEKGFVLAHWAQTHKEKVLSGLGIFLLLGVGMASYMFWDDTQNENASLAYEAAFKDFKNDDKQTYAAALASLSVISEDFSASRVSGLAELYAGHLALEEGKTKEAVNLYQKFDSQANAKNDLKALGMSGLAYAYLRNNEKEKALGVFEKILDSNFGIAEDMTLWEVSRLSMDLGHKEKALKTAELLKEKHPTSSFVAQADLLSKKN